MMRLKSQLDYDPKTGQFHWKIAKGRRAAGSLAGSTNKNTGYIYVGLDGAIYLAHRLAWRYMTGRWPTAQVDHINRDRRDNRWCNLRSATAAENSRNAPKRRGLKGVTWHDGGRKWQASIKVNNKNKHLGLFATPEAAHQAYCTAAKKYHGEFASNE